MIKQLQEAEPGWGLNLLSNKHFYAAGKRIDWGNDLDRQFGAPACQEWK